ncbi:MULTISPECIES: sensor domain-containing diguanylate cyclase [unclassified Undibacterium]|uniref:sensor domain-containing diguanylate cyclase n=1 Tax=unclassified Undibacterium TaxID=2630295 RepID=UPI002AC8F985|nr:MULTISPECIES: sensor domain-containing diguanylate cyclase [unclassified Undibacterium]MEB0138906.1 sensor domain-containing diguanylate cyclase [Undibacterium sp. CCC2.1]MEB0171763.1 sensor domain-containing diguanylate cyclase [Undibacterium sp. CCC1.1]MEB0175537.1 sensor domain-containing diguanylate cyclase [Undibacterium sp. CCC3.4]MEB0214965.1 sensor domain-containing diguanylate cyclase [Undibacterium sp. 5I2]WPX44946.1 sensor domain-containing diguanylate cyclase [Undibacterium sp. 
MKNLFKKYGLLVWLSLILMCGFVSTTLVGFVVSRDMLQQTLSEQTLPITGDNVYSEIQKDILRPVYVSSQMAHDTFVRDWLISGEEDKEQIAKYLKEIKFKNNAVASFLVSDLSHNYYNTNGNFKTIHQEEPRDAWFYRVKALKTAYETNVDVDTANHDAMTIFINHRILDYNGKFIGVTGIGLTFDSMKQLIDRNQERFHSTIYFVDNKGKIALAGSTKKNRDTNLSDIDGLDQLAPQILANRSSLHLDYQNNGNTVLLNARYIPELGWHLLVEQSSDTSALQQIFWINLAIGAAITLLITIMVWLTVRRYHARLEKSASTDTLTKLMNRHAFDFIFQQALLDSERSRQPMCAVLMDIDFFKKVNDKQGHLVGDHVLKEIAAIAKRSLRESDVICRWGGEEFLILLKNCGLEKATSIAENLRNTIANNDFSRTTDLTRTRLAITVSMGVAACRDNETEDSVFERADQALYQAKENGRNSVYFSE